MEEFLQDKIFQFYYQKTFGKDSNYLSFKTFNDKDKISFLINLYLFISNYNNKNSLNDDSILNKLYNEYNTEYQISNQISENEEDLFYKDNYNKIMNDFNQIVNKYNNNQEIQFTSTIPLNNDIESSCFEKSNNDTILNINNFPNMKNAGCNAYMKYNYDYNLNNNDSFDKEIISKNSSKQNLKLKIKNIINENNELYKELSDTKYDDIILKSVKNDINININNKPQLKLNSPLCIVNNNSYNKVNTILSIQCNKNFSRNNISFFTNLSQSFYSSNNTKRIIEIPIIDTEETKNINKINQSTSLVNLDKTIFKDLILINSTDKQIQKEKLAEFKEGNIVDKLFNCPQNKYISLNCTEANKLAQVIISLMETKNDLENVVEEEKKKNDVRLNRLKMDCDRIKNNLKSDYDLKQLNLLEELNKIKSEINQKQNELKNYKNENQSWDHITIEKEETKKIKDMILQKIDLIKFDN